MLVFDPYHTIKFFDANRPVATAPTSGKVCVHQVLNKLILSTVTITEYGFCMSDQRLDIAPSHDGHIHGSSKTHKMLDITLAYNLSDWTAGYFGEIGGFTAYFNAPGQATELRDVKTRVVLSGKQSTRVTLRTLHENNLTPPLG